VLIPFRGSFQNTNAALALVLVVVAFASTGHRVAGVVAALSAGVWFDFFLTVPYERFAIRDQADVETAALLLLVGLGVTEVAIWGRRQQARASRDEGYLAGVSAASEVVARGGSSPSELIARVCDQMTATLGLVRCRFDYGTGLDHPRLHSDGRVTLRRETWDVRRGVPQMGEAIELYAESGGSFRGRFLLTPPPNFRLSQTQIAVATSLADEVGASLTEFEARHA
jgi:hypothetical protein